MITKFIIECIIYYYVSEPNSSHITENFQCSLFKNLNKNFSGFPFNENKFVGRDPY